MLPDHEGVTNDVTRVILASGKVVHELDAEREKRGDTSTAIVRVEQLYPIPEQEIREAVSRYPGAELFWVQDEPRNQGAWPLMAQWLHEDLCQIGETRPWRIVARKASASPATGSSKKHAAEQSDLMDRAFGR